MKQVVLYSMKGCPFCDQMKDLLKESDVDYIERDIDEYEREYDTFVEATGNDFIPAFMLIEHEGEKVKDVKLMAPDRDFDDIHEALEKVKIFL
jgi:glutaredoxin